MVGCASCTRPVHWRYRSTTDLRRGADEVQFVFRTGSTSLLAAYDGPASVEVDEINEAQGRAWSVIARGVLRRVVGTHDLPDTVPWIDGKSQWMVLTVTAISGRRFVRQAADGGFSVEWRMASL